MATGTQGKSMAWLCVKFIVLAPICLVLWLLVLPKYTWLLGNASGLLLKYVFQYPIEGVEAPAAGFLNTGTSLVYVMGGHRLTMEDVGKLVTNIAPYLALVLATSGLGAWRRARVIAIGVAIIFVFHAATIILRFTAGRTTLPTAIGFIAITLPFLLWIVLAYWDKVMAYLGTDDESPAPPSDAA